MEEEYLPSPKSEEAPISDLSLSIESDSGKQIDPELG
jgi:hypothetical protein